MMSSQAEGVPTLLPEEEEVLGDPSFELWVRNGKPVVSGSYFLHPPLRAVDARWDPADRHRVLVRADDGSEWFATDVPLTGSVTVVLRPVSGSHPAFRAAAAARAAAADAD
jgi:hypothetical protein